MFTYHIDMSGNRFTIAVGGILLGERFHQVHNIAQNHSASDFKRALGMFGQDRDFLRINVNIIGAILVDT